MNGPNDRMLDIDGFDDRRRDVCRFYPRRRIGFIAAGGDAAGVGESNAGDDRRKNQFHDVLVHVMPPFVLTTSKDGVPGKSDKIARINPCPLPQGISVENLYRTHGHHPGRRHLLRHPRQAPGISLPRRLSVLPRFLV